MAYVYLASAFLLNALGNIFLKLGAGKGMVFTGNPAFFLANNWLFVAGLLFFGLNAVFYFLALRSLPISTAYPIMVVMSFILINSYALTVLGEHLAPLQVAGYALLVLGLLLIIMPSA